MSLLELFLMIITRLRRWDAFIIIIIITAKIIDSLVFVCLKFKWLSKHKELYSGLNRLIEALVREISLVLRVACLENGKLCDGAKKDGWQEEMDKKKDNSAVKHAGKLLCSVSLFNPYCCMGRRCAEGKYKTCQDEMRPSSSIWITSCIQTRTEQQDGADFYLIPLSHHPCSHLSYILVLSQRCHV